MSKKKTNWRKKEVEKKARSERNFEEKISNFEKYLLSAE